MLALFMAAGGLGACSSTSVTDMIPSVAGGLPANAPQRSAAQPEYPTVTEMPRRPEALPMTDEELNRTKAELTTLRNKQEELAGNAPPPATAAGKTPADAAKAAKKPKDAKQPAEQTAAKDQPKQ